MPKTRKFAKKPKVERFAVDVSLLNNPEEMSPLGRTLLSISQKIRKSGAKPRSLKQIHRELARME